MSKLSQRKVNLQLFRTCWINIRFSRNIEPLKKKSGGYGAVVTPVPIPNTEVKHRSGEGSWGTGKNSALLGFFFYGA